MMRANFRFFYPSYTFPLFTFSLFSSTQFFCSLSSFPHLLLHIPPSSFLFSPPLILPLPLQYLFLSLFTPPLSLLPPPSQPSNSDYSTSNFTSSFYQLYFLQVPSSLYSFLSKFLFFSPSTPPSLHLSPPPTSTPPPSIHSSTIHHHVKNYLLQLFISFPNEMIFFPPTCLLALLDEHCVCQKLEVEETLRGEIPFHWINFQDQATKKKVNTR